MKIADKTVVSINYTLTDVDGNILDSTKDRDPLTYLQGVGGLIPGLEKALEGQETGYSNSITVAPEDAFGNYEDANVQVVPLSGFQSDGDEKLQEGMQVQVQSNQGAKIAFVTKIEGEDVTLDLNHPLAGQTLNFDVEVTDVREATKDELDHGHAHGPGGHQH